MESTLVLDFSKEQLFAMSKLVENALESSLIALMDSKPLIAREVIENDKVINSYEIDIDNSTYNLLAKTQVPADMLRTILSIQKINAMLERIGDHAVNIAESAISLICEPKEPELFNLPKMADLCKKILHDSIDGFCNNNLDIATDVLTRDDVIDALNIKIGNSVKQRVHAGTMSFEVAMEIIRICKNLERVADLSTNIAEETSFTIVGKIMKHIDNQNKTGIVHEKTLHNY
jgi:phosphate transport system protein